MSRILVVGSTAYDVLLSHDGDFREPLKTVGDAALSLIYLTPHYKRHHGGTAANIAWSLVQLGKNALPVSTVGEDGGSYIALLEERGVDVRFIEKIDNDVTATAIIATDSDEQQLGFYHPGADRHGTWPDLADERDDISHAIISPREEKVMLAAIDWCKKFGVPYYFDPGQRLTSMATDDLNRSMLGSAGVIVNDYEWSMLQTRTGVNEQSIFEKTQQLIITRGEHGVTIKDIAGARSIKACTCDHVVNPTGAGDAFRAGFLAGLSSGWTADQAARLGAALGSCVVEIEGTMLDMLDKDFAWERARCTYGESLPELD